MKSPKFIIAVLGIFVILYLLAQYNRPKGIDWSKSLDDNDKIPFGTYITYNRLGDIFSGAQVEKYREPVYNVINDHQVNDATYLVICNSIDLNEYDFGKLKQFISKGNDVFIAASYFGDELNKELKIDAQTEFGDTTGTRVRFINQSIDTTRYYASKKAICDGYFHTLDTGRATGLGANNYKHYNYVRYNFGKGYLYLNANPLMFTNYSLLTSDGSAYAATALSFARNSKHIVWDEYYTQGRDDDDSTMRVFLRNLPLRMAFYITFFSLIIFVVYEVKRRQRVIPVIEPLRNTSIDFVKVVGQVYYGQRDNVNIAQKKANYFLEHIRTKYNLKTTVLNAEFSADLVQKSEADAGLINALVHQITIIRAGIAISDNELITFNQNIEQFYTQSRQ